MRVRRAGYCNRQPYEVFVSRYKMLTKKTWPTYRCTDAGNRIGLIMTDGLPFAKLNMLLAFL